MRASARASEWDPKIETAGRGSFELPSRQAQSAVGAKPLEGKLVVPPYLNGINSIGFSGWLSKERNFYSRINWIRRKGDPIRREGSGKSGRKWVGRQFDADDKRKKSDSDDLEIWELNRENRDRFHSFIPHHHNQLVPNNQGVHKFGQKENGAIDTDNGA